MKLQIPAASVEPKSQQLIVKQETNNVGRVRRRKGLGDGVRGEIICAPHKVRFELFSGSY